MSAPHPEASPKPQPAGAIRRHAPAMAAYAALTVLLTWPLAVDAGAWVPHDLGDPLLSTWTLWWNAQRLPFTAAWWDGPVFHPASGSLAFSDHRVGISLFTTPMIRAGVSPLAAHNVAWLLGYGLSAATAYALAWTLARRRSAAFVAGLVYGFHPFRAEHLPHLELLSSYWLPLVLLALHQFVATGRARWLALLAVSLILTGFTTGYYFFFLGVLIGLWLIWFVPRDRPLSQYIALAVALAAPFVPLAPVLLGYRAIHQQYGLARSITEIEELSADIRGLLAAPDALLAWNVPAAWRTPEGALFPGATALVLVIVALLRGRRAEATVSRPRAVRARRWLLGLGLFAVGVALVPVIAGPQRIDIGPLGVSVTDVYKPMSVALLLLAAWGLSAAPVRDAWRLREALPFYALAMVAMWLFALGPTARLAGERVLYKAPYSWLMLLPGFADGFRAPARFAMLGALCLSAAAALALVRLTASLSSGTRAVFAGVVAAGVLADGLVFPAPLEPAPKAFVVPPEVPPEAAVLELPIGVFEDAAAMYHGTQHGRPVVNGLSGYEPPHYGALRGAIRDGDTGVVEMVATDRPLAVFVSRAAAAGPLASLLPAQSRARPVAVTDAHEVFLVDRGSRARFAEPETDRVRRLAALTAATNGEQVGRALDGDRRTAWTSGGPQQGNESLVARLAQPGPVSGVVLALGAFPSGFPRELAVRVSDDGANWQTVWRGPTGARTVAAALDDPLDVRVVIDVPSTPARLVWVSQLGRSAADEWAVAEFAVLR